MWCLAWRRDRLPGYLIAYIKYLKKTPRTVRGAVRPEPPLEEEEFAPFVSDTGATHDHVSTTVIPPTATRRSRGTEIAPGSRMPGRIVTTKTGLEDTHIYHSEGWHVTRAGLANNTSVTFRKCDICF